MSGKGSPNPHVRGGGGGGGGDSLVIATKDRPRGMHGERLKMHALACSLVTFPPSPHPPPPEESGALEGINPFVNCYGLYIEADCPCDRTKTLLAATLSSSPTLSSSSGIHASHLHSLLPRCHNQSVEAQTLDSGKRRRWRCQLLS